MEGVAHTFDLNMVPEAISKKLEPMLMISILKQRSRKNVQEACSSFVYGFLCHCSLKALINQFIVSLLAILMYASNSRLVLTFSPQSIYL